jgi:hypothetical protein
MDRRPARNNIGKLQLISQAQPRTSGIDEARLSHKGGEIV